MLAVSRCLAPAEQHNDFDDAAGVRHRRVFLTPPREFEVTQILSDLRVPFSAEADVLCRLIRVQL